MESWERHSSLTNVTTNGAGKVCHSPRTGRLQGSRGGHGSYAVKILPSQLLRDKSRPIDAAPALSIDALSGYLPARPTVPPKVNDAQVPP